MKKVELLSPAGDYESFISAMSGGCDAVYLSGTRYGARAYAKNFTDEEIIKAIETAHLYSRKVYLTVNTLLKNDELEALYDYIYPFYIAGLDSVIVQDIGVISYISKHFPRLSIHASTQLAITSYEGIKLLSGLNVKRCVLARELSLQEIRTIHSRDDMELECFIHGALCYSYSGKCLISSLIGGRSGNRGRCAGTCRQPYNGKYVLSTKDICCLSILPELISSGITSFKIEGRMKSPEYVYGVTSMYRKYIDLCCDNMPDLENKAALNRVKKDIFSGTKFQNDLSVLEKLYTRGGNSTGYYFKNNGRDMISLDDASYKTDYKDSAGTGAGEEYYVNRPDNISCIAPLNKLKISGKITIQTGLPISLSLKYKDYEVSVSSTAAERAQKSPTDENTVKKQLLKTGDTVFEFENIEYDISDDAFVKISDLNALRRSGLTALKDKILNNTRRSKPNNDCVNDLSAYHTPYIKDEPYRYTFTADICTVKQLNASLKYPEIRRVYVPYSLCNDIENIQAYGKQVYIKFQSIIRHGFLSKNHDDILRSINSADGVLIDNNELLYFIKESGYDKPVVADIHLYCLNKEAAAVYSALSVDRFTVPVELNKHELFDRGLMNEELIVYGHIPVMISAQCVNNTLYGCDKTEKQIKLTDRKNAVFTCVNDCKACTNTIFNSVPVSLHGERDFIEALRPESLKLCFTTEDYGRAEEVLDFFVSGDFNKNNPPYKHFTKGHLNRGVL